MEIEAASGMSAGERRQVTERATEVDSQAVAMLVNAFTSPALVSRQMQDGAGGVRLAKAVEILLDLASRVPASSWTPQGLAMVVGAAGRVGFLMQDGVADLRHGPAGVDGEAAARRKFDDDGASRMERFEGWMDAMAAAVTPCAYPRLEHITYRRTRTRMHARTHARTHAHTPTAQVHAYQRPAKTLSDMTMHQ